MEPRLKPFKVAPAALKVMWTLPQYTELSGGLAVEGKVIELALMRASQINGCARCVAMHARDARKGGETDDRLHQVSVWHDSPHFNPRERAALLWTEALTVISEDHLPDHVYEEVRAVFTEREIVDLTMAVIAINSWNRLNVAFRIPDSSVSN
jgi:AhpD family alkylhydroperoxidase